jgi:hypothetical protein
MNMHIGTTLTISLQKRDAIVRQFSSKETVTITYVDPSGDEHPVEAEVGQHLLDVAHANNIELEGMKWRFFYEQR